MPGATVNVPFNFNKTFKKLPPCTGGLILLKSKTKISFKGHAFFQLVSRTKLVNALIYFNANNPLYHDITIDLSEIPNDLMTFSDGPIDFKVDSSTTELEIRHSEDVSNHLDNYRPAPYKSLIVDNSVFDIAPGVDKDTKSILFDENCEELEFSSLFLNAKFGYSCKRQTKLSCSK